MARFAHYPSPPPPPLPSERETAAFSVKNCVPWNIFRGPTVPQPFHFVTAERGMEAETAGGAEKIDARPLPQRALLERLLEEENMRGGGVNETFAFGAANLDITRM